MKWRNAEGREFPDISFTVGAWIDGDTHVKGDTMRALGYELVEDSPDSSVTAEQVAEIPSGSPHAFVGRHDRDCEVCGLPDRAPIHRGFATQVGAPSANDESVRLSQVPSETLAQFCYELVGRLDQADRDGARANWRHILYGALGPLVVGEFEVVCGMDLGIGLAGATVGGEASLRDPRLIPGKTYVVREKV